MLFSTLATIVLSLSSLASFGSAAAIPEDARASVVEARASPGRGTWYEVGLGACEKYNKNSQPIIAMNHVKWNKKKLCGKWITVKSGKKSATGYIMDMCPGCGSKDLDLSPSLFKKFAPLGKGVIPVTFKLPGSKREILARAEAATNATITPGPDSDDDFDYDSFPPEMAATEEDFLPDDDEVVSDSA